MPEWLQSRAEALKWAAGIIGSIAALVASWTSLGGPVPATRAWVASYYETQQEGDRIRGQIRAITKALTELEDGEARDGLIEQRDALEARLEELGRT